jgi:(R,R)-butanediol dehydrogenase/meso-butanediol dehydrogenase/diacetyl reductase
MKAVVWHGGHNFTFEDVDPPHVKTGQIIVKVEAAAICGSDFHQDDFGSKPPLVLGHEVSGAVNEVGPGVSGVSVGDRVALDPVQKCGTCWCCSNGIEHLCQNYRHLGDQAVPGGWAEYVAVDARNAYAIPDNVDFIPACLLEPTAVCYQSLERSRFGAGQSILIIGDGPFGFLHAQIAQAKGAAKIIVSGHYDERLDRIAASTGAITCNTHYQELQPMVEEVVGFPGVDVAIEATGAGNAPDLGIQALRPRGTIVIFSYIWKPLPIQMGLIHMRELNVLGACRSQGGYRPCLDLMGEGKVDPAALVDVLVPLQDYQVAVDKLLHDKAHAFKAVFQPQR